MVNNRCIFHVFSYLGLISFIFTIARVFAWGFNFFSLCAVVFAKKLNPRANTPTAVKMSEINPKYENTRKIQQLLTNQTQLSHS